jgi:hypothetical protein
MGWAAENRLEVAQPNSHILGLACFASFLLSVPPKSNRPKIFFLLSTLLLRLAASSSTLERERERDYSADWAKMALAAATIVPPACKPPLPLLLPLLLTRRSVSVRASPPRQQQHRQRPPPPRRHPPRGRTRPRPPAPPDHDDDYYDDDDEQESRFAGGTRATAMPKPPAGFVLDDQGRCIAAASKRIVTIVRPASSLSLVVCELNPHSGNLSLLLQIDDTNNRPLECIIRRVFRSSQGQECMLLCPVDMYVPLPLCLYLFFMNKCHGALVLLPPKFSQFPVSGLCRSSRAQISVAGLLYAST